MAPFEAWPDPVKRLLAHINPAIYVPMQGPSELGLSGSLETWDRSGALESIDVPTLTIGATHDTMDPAHMQKIAGMVRDGRSLNLPDGSHTDLALADRDARCWVGAVDRTVGITSASGLSLCLRLLALIDLLARAPWARSLFHLARDGAEFHPALLRAAASAPLTRDARFDEAGFRVRLARFISGFQIEDSQAAQRLSGAH